MNNKKKMTIVIVILALVCVLAVLVFTGVIKLGKLGGEEESTDNNLSDYSFDENTYKAAALATGQLDTPYLETDIQDVFYTMSKDGTVKFYKYASNAFTEISNSGTYDVSVVMSEQELSATITYYKDGDTISGYGLYSGKTGEYNLYPYAFFRLANYGKDCTFGDSDSCYLLVDTTADDFYSNDKIYEEPFIFSFSDGSTERLLSEANRTVGLEGTKRADYSMINDAVIAGSWNTQLFFSGRQYSEKDEKVDLLRSGGSGNNTDNVRIAKDVLCYWATYVKGGILYITVDENDNVVLTKYIIDDESTEAVKTFDGVKRDDILVSDNYIYIISKNVIYSIDENTEVTLGLSVDGKFKADAFSITGDKCMLRGYVDEVYPTVVSANVADGTVKFNYTNMFFKELVNPIILSDGHALVTIISGEKFDYYIY